MEVLVRIGVAYLGVVALLLGLGRTADAQTSSRGGQDTGAYKLELPVDEVVLTFHATDADGLPVNDLKASELRLRDNGGPPHRIVAFESLQDRPVRAEILIDTSESMARELPRAKLIAERYAQELFRQKTDQAAVMDFAFASEIAQQWVSDPVVLERSIANVKPGPMNPAGGTAIFSAIYQACSYEFGKGDPTKMGNFILLFSDGEDTAGLTTMEDALRACQRSNTAIYAFRVSPDGDFDSTGPKTLSELAAKTGGEVFPADDSEDAIRNDLRAIESRMRNEYRLVYNPANFRHDGAFHEIEIQPPDRVSRIDVRSGYYAPVQ